MPASARPAAIGRPQCRCGWRSPDRCRQRPGPAWAGVGRDRQAPTRWEVAGWYAPGTRPGDPGSAVILGHVDSKSGPAVFFRLRELRRGDMVTITRANGSSVRFIVQRTEQYPKDRFPTDDVYTTLTPAAAGDLRRGLRRHRGPLPVECDRLRHHAALICPAWFRGLQLALVHDLPVVGQGAVEPGRLPGPDPQRRVTRSSTWGPDSLRLAVAQDPALLAHRLPQPHGAGEHRVGRSTAVLHAAEAIGPTVVMVVGRWAAEETSAVRCGQPAVGPRDRADQLPH